MNKGVIRTRDVVVHFKSDAYPVAIHTALRQQGWKGGQGVQWVDSAKDEFMVGRSDGLYGGFLLWGSDEDSDVYVSLQMNQPAYGYAILCTGGWIASFRVFEKYTWASRQSGPLVENVFPVGERVRFSLRGLWTPEDEWNLSGDPRGDNGFTVASIVESPSPDFLVLQTAI